MIRMRTYFKDFDLKGFLMKNGIVICVLFFVLFMGISNNKFLTLGNITNIVSASGIAYLCSMAMALCMFARCIDLSIGGNVYLCATVASFMAQRWIATPYILVTMLGVGLLCGLLNGFITASLGVFPLLTTIAANFIFRGMGFVLTRGSLTSMTKEWNNIIGINLLGIPISIFLPFFIGITLQALMKITPLGRKIYAVGDNEKKARERGLNVFRIKIIVYALNGLLCGVAAVLLSAQVMSAPSSLGVGLENTAMLASVLGGVSFSGGKGNLFPGVLLGALLYSTISNALVLLRASAYLYDVIYGCVILVVIVIDVLRKRQATTSVM